MRRLLLITAAFFALSPVLGAENRLSLLESKYAEPGVAQSFRPGTDWIPYPAYKDREGWHKLLGDSYAKSLIKTGEQFLGYRWRHVPASIYLLRAETGNNEGRNRYNNVNRKALISLAMAELAEGQGRFLKDLADGFWFYATSGHWSITGETGGKILPALENESVALGNVRVSAMLCPFWALFKDEFEKMDPMINKTFKETAERIIMKPFMDPANHYWWIGNPKTRKLNNWTPWCCHGVLCAFLTLEEDQARIDAALRKCFAAVDQYLSDFPTDGMCNEGSTYWFQSVVRLEEFLQLVKDASYGRMNIMPNDFISSMGAYISRCCAGQSANGKEIVVNYGDAHPFANFDTFSLWKCSEYFDDEELQKLAIYASWNGSKFKMSGMEKSEGYRALENARIAKALGREIKKYNDKIKKEGLDAESILEDLRADVPAYTWFPDGQQLFVKTSDNLFFSAKAAHNGESHNHNDVGSCILFANGSPVLIDPGVGTYTAKTFGPQRYTLWTMVSPWHNVPVINGIDQHQGGQYASSEVVFSNDGKVYSLSFNMEGAYLEESDCASWKREYTVIDKASGSTIEIKDSYVLGSRQAPDVEHFLTAFEPVIVKPGIIRIKTDTGKIMELSYPAKLLKATVDTQEDLDADLARTWCERIYRINLSSGAKAPASGTYTIKIKALL